MNYIVFEIQTTDGKTASIATAFSELDKAESKYYAVLSAAAVSEVSCHAAMLINQSGEPILWHGFNHITESEG